MKNLQEFDTLADAQVYKVTGKSLISGDMMRKFMVETGLYGYFKTHTGDAQSAAYDNLFGGEFNFINDDDRNITALFSLIISEAENDTIEAQLNSLLSKCLNYANPESFPFADVNQERFDACKDAYSELTSESFSWGGEHYLRVTLNQDLYEPKTATLFFTNKIFTNENLGVPKRLDKAGVYIFDLSKVRKGECQLHVNFNIKADAKCELV